jgi:hypothetical protein
VVGQPRPGTPDCGVGDGALAALLAEADGGGGAGVGASFDGTVLTVPSRPGARPAVVPVATPADVVAALAVARDDGADAIALELGFDPGAPTRDVALPPARDPSLAARLPAPDLPADGTHTFDLVFAGSEVMRSGAVHAIRDLADATGLGVLNVFTAKGMFRFDSPFHLGTVGLQLHDFTYAGLDPERRILAIGVGRDECPEPLLRDAGIALDGVWPVTGAAVDRIGALATQVRAAHDGPPAVGELFTRLSGVVQPLYRDERVPLNPARAAADVAESLPFAEVNTMMSGGAP